MAKKKKKKITETTPVMEQSPSAELVFIEACMLRRMKPKSEYRV